MDHGYAVEFGKVDCAVGGEGANGWDEALCGGAAGKACIGNEGGRMDCICQGQAAGCTAGIDEQDIQTVRSPGGVPPPKSPKILTIHSLGLD